MSAPIDHRLPPPVAPAERPDDPAGRKRPKDDGKPQSPKRRNPKRKKPHRDDSDRDDGTEPGHEIDILVQGALQTEPRALHAEREEPDRAALPTPAFARGHCAPECNWHADC